MTYKGPRQEKQIKEQIWNVKVGDIKELLLIDGLKEWFEQTINELTIGEIIGEQDLALEMQKQLMRLGAYVYLERRSENV